MSETSGVDRERSTTTAPDEVLDALAVLSKACARAGAIGYVVIDQPDFTRFNAATGGAPRRFVNSHLGDPAMWSTFVAIGLLSGGEAIERANLLRTANASQKIALAVDPSRSIP